MDNDRFDIGALYESIYAGDQAFGGEEEEKEEKDTDTEDTEEKDTRSSEETSDDGEKSSDDSDSEETEEKEGDSEGEESEEDGEDGESDEEGDSEVGEDGNPKGDGSFSTSVESLRKQYSDLLAKVFGEFAPDAIESALDGSDGPFGDNIQTIIQSAIDNLKSMIYDEFELEEVELGIDPAAMGGFDPTAEADRPMELEIEPKSEEDEGGEEEDDKGLEEGCKKHKKKKLKY